ncbi:MAG: STAS domain-containing protein [Ignavibacteriales bacterium]|nr:STAS domain-containing protein [Ignavibacteriales bacterium]
MIINTSRQGEIVILDLDGRLDIHSTEGFKNTIQTLIDGGFTKIILDCNKLSFISSAGLRILIVAQGNLEPKGGEVCFFGFNSNTRKIFDITGYCNLFKIFENRLAAIEYFTK